MRAYLGVVLAVWACVGGAQRSSDPNDIPSNMNRPIMDSSKLPDIPLGNPESMKTDTLAEPLDEEDFNYELPMSDAIASHSAFDPIFMAGLFEGDIQLASESDLASILLGGPRQRSGIADQHKRWPNARIPYVISNSFDKLGRATIATAIKNFQQLTCIRFVARTSETDYVHFIKGDGCSSSVGRVGGGQAISIGMGCGYVGIVMHEIMHAVGFWHEHSRPDRDKHISIKWANIKPNMEYNFHAYTWEKVKSFGISYDVGSIMHYGYTAFSKDGNNTIEPRRNQKGVEMGQREDLSNSDKKKINAMYCKGTPVGVSTSPSKFCDDTNGYCDEWALLGECKKNPVFMEVSCCLSCRKAKQNDVLGCRDQEKYCSLWSKKGECTSNSNYMALKCKKSCGLCPKSRRNLPPSELIPFVSTLT
ncbi:zinc metalloproteinase nas-4-like [Homarus americanus]|uniref:Zinc metalloproteinase nas-15-like 2 n=1 Tax=Homarus americanus TaxID=6706 RepID=A0A8J5JPE7_HOMAM|nr:zinc metalloproteinase nas-4-like [Homarus americanus]XP_042239338.1 zinc metalloproteinase nas-4-like [Homarus americanus]KAG7159340.1 Zinc metalloproteinase nas-15-like 2 [Homarus americanus]